jgi:SAM-dependent methyltransferase
VYELIARLYDSIHSDYSEDIRFLIAQEDSIQGPILELGCGTGRMLMHLAEAGYRVIGIDSSPAMLAEARIKVANSAESIQERISLLQGDITSFKLKERFGLIICSHNTLYHLKRGERISCFRLIHQHLSDGGIFFIDIDNPVEVADPIDDGLLLMERKVSYQAGNNVLLQFTSSWVDEEAERCHLTWIFDESPEAGGQVNRIVVNTIFHYASSHQLEGELSQAGFSLRAVYGDYGHEPYSELSPLLLLLAEKSAKR